MPRNDYTAAMINSRMSRPRILVTRAPHQASELADHLRALGADPILIPTIELAEPTSYAALDKTLAELATYDWLIFTSANAVATFATRLTGGVPPSLKVAAIGAATARALKSAGMPVALVPPQAVAESLTEALLPYAQRGVRFLLVRAEQARDHLPETLTATGAEVVVAPAYRTVVPEGTAEALRKLFAENLPDAVTFTSSSSARNLLELLETSGVELPSGVMLASIGPITSATLAELGYPAGMESTNADVVTLARELINYFKK